MANDKVIIVENLKKSYGNVKAVDGISFEVENGEIFGIVGPNGAGKTTTIECVEGIRSSDSGNITVLGLAPQRDEYALRKRIGLQLQESALQNRIKVWEALDLFASFYAKPVDWNALMQRLNLDVKKDTPFDKLSGGQKQRLFIALSLINDPELVFFDELTTGLDPQARRNMWDLVREIRNQGKSIVLTTHFMEEAERLCDRVAIVDQGKIIALDTPETLIRNLGAENRVVFTVNGKFDLNNMRKLKGVSKVEQLGDRCIVYGTHEKLVTVVVNALSERNYRFSDLRTEQPNLEDVFLTLTGKEMRT